MLKPIAFALCALAATPALAERPADILARLRGGRSADAGPMGSDFPVQYDLYRHVRPPVIVFPGWLPPPPPPCAGTVTTVTVGVQGGPVTIVGGVTSGAVTCLQVPMSVTTTTTTTTTTTSTTGAASTTSSGGVVLAPALPVAADAAGSQGSASQ